MKENLCFKQLQFDYINSQKQKRERTRKKATVSIKVVRLPKTDDRICLKYYKNIYLLFICFLYCVNEGRAVENIESDVATLKIVTKMEQIFQLVFIAPDSLPEKKISRFLK